ncbi:MAG: ECF transporter S component [candidate division KSB1 bacterium]|nr:ECF transporter S component [candidate division KSB1 bacterium]MDZ7334851.1 ECF transporter S component [candidate division KSB1 bacterium]MDZ7357868.1 ECF transporter S component [candidate division KSB1 bacterium]MDZ7376906.1 ECF transporter S component [candidate division KSB1 bacterium]MDZ7400420.1 ECF transporter S component [candidate division KSB1 bacterium]
MLNKISTLDAVFIALMAACGLALKPIIGPLFKLIGSAFLIPSGSLAGAVYMIWPSLAILIVRHIGAATLVGIIQGIIVLVTGIYGSHGILSLLTYTVPGIVIDLVYWLIRGFRYRWLMFLPAAFGNAAGSAIVGIILMHIPLLPLILGLIPAFIFGGIGGLLSLLLYSALIEVFPIFDKSKLL